MKTSKIFTLSIAFLSFLLPLFFLPLTVDFYTFNKLTLFYFFVSLLLILWAIKTYFGQKIVFVKNPLTLPVVGLTAGFLLSTLIQAPNKPMSLAFSSGLILFSSLLFFIIINQIKSKDQIKWILAGLITASVVLAWLTVFAYLGLTENIGPA